MNKQPGIFIALEGTDGSGKSTQFKLLAQRLKDNGHEVETISFPQYDEQSSYFVKQYLAGKFGESENIGPYTVSMFYSLDRYHSAEKIRKWIGEGKVVLADRFTGSNMAHQGTLFSNAAQRRGFFIWLDQIEFEMLKIPRPDLSLVLRMPADLATKNINSRGEQKDINEKNPDHLKLSVEVYDSLCELFPKDFKRIDCVRNNELLSRKRINHLLWQTLQPILPDAKKKDFQPKNTEVISESLSSYVTNTDKNVYAFTGRLSQQTTAAAMARLSRKYEDLRNIIIDEFSDPLKQNDTQLLRRIVSDYGDDSVQQLVGQHFVVEGVSNLVTKKIEKHRLGAYLEQSTRYIYYDRKDKDGKYVYFIPNELGSDVKDKYISTMNAIFENYSQVVHKLTDYIRSNSEVQESDRNSAWRSATKASACDIARNVLPVSTKSTIGIFMSAQSLEGLVMDLLADDIAESKQIGRDILDEARKVIPVFLERADKKERGAETTKYKKEVSLEIGEITKKYISNQFSTDMEKLRLVDYSPRNELNIAADILYEQSTLSLSEIKSDLENASIDHKRNIIKAYVGERSNRRQKPGRALEKIHYSWDILCDYGIFRDLARHRMVDNLAWQQLSPRYGYSLPEIVEQAGLEDVYTECFDLSLRLYGDLQAMGYENEAQYAVLMGHRIRWQVTFNAREAFHILELRTSEQGHPAYRELVQQMHNKISEVHPLIAGSMSFVNHSTPVKLARLESERKIWKH